MVKVKSLFDAAKPEDGTRLWVDATPLTLDLTEWCKVDHWLRNAVPPVKPLRRWRAGRIPFITFVNAYHVALAESPYLSAIRELADSLADENITVLHYDDNPYENVATAFATFVDNCRR